MISVDDVNTNLVNIIIENTYKIFNTFLPKLKEVYLNTYANELLDIDVNKDSLAKPEYFYTLYSDALDKFNYIEVNSKLEIKFKSPSENSFNFEGKLSFIHILTIGIIGSYIEISREDYTYLVNNLKLSKQINDILLLLPGFLDEDELLETDFYLLDTEYNIHSILEQVLGKKLIAFPFSNMPPIDLFSEGINYFNSKKNELTNMIINKSIEDLKRRSY
jgi:hypothetical protein